MSRDIVPIDERGLFWKDPFFSTTWDEFDKMRQDMMSRSKGFWDNVNKDMANFDEAVKKSHAEMDMSIAPFRPQPLMVPHSLPTNLPHSRRTFSNFLHR